MVAAAPIARPALGVTAQFLVVAAAVAAVPGVLLVLVAMVAMVMSAFGAGNYDLCNS